MLPYGRSGQKSIDKFGFYYFYEIKEYGQSPNSSFYYLY